MIGVSEGLSREVHSKGKIDVGGEREDRKKFKR